MQEPDTASSHLAAPLADRTSVEAAASSKAVTGAGELGAIGREGSFLWQMDSPSGAGMNLWSGKLSGNNGYPEQHAIQAAMLFEAAPDLLEALRGAEREVGSRMSNALIRRVYAALDKATGGAA